MRLVRWDGTAWADTPVKVLPQPPWMSREGPPWSAWSYQKPSYFPGRDGSVLAVAVHDVYQDAFAEAKDGQKIDRWTLRDAAKMKVDGGKPVHWIEAWYFRNGKWTGPVKLREMLEKECDALSAAFTKPAPLGNWFVIRGDGNGTVWAAFEDTVYRFTKTGVQEWKIPGERRAGFYHVSPLPDGRMLCASSDGNRAQLHALSVKDNRIVAEAFPVPDWGDRLYFWGPPSLHVAKDKTLRLWLPTANNRHARVWEFHDGKWANRDDLGDFLFEEADGALWFMPGSKVLSKSPDHWGYQVVKGEQTTMFAWPREYGLGRLTPTRDGRVMATAGYWLVELQKADDPLKRRLANVRILSGYWGPGQAFQAPDGTVFVGNQWGK